MILDSSAKGRTAHHSPCGISRAFFILYVFADPPTSRTTWPKIIVASNSEAIQSHQGLCVPQPCSKGNEAQNHLLHLLQPSSQAHSGVPSRHPHQIFSSCLSTQYFFPDSWAYLQRTPLNSDHPNRENSTFIWPKPRKLKHKSQTTNIQSTNIQDGSLRWLWVLPRK